MAITNKVKETEQVKEFMDRLIHPLKAEVNAVRTIIKEVSPDIAERIKWAAPSYYTVADLVTFNLHNLNKVHLVFHHIAIVQVKSGLLEGAYKDRRMIYFDDLEAVEANKNELIRIMQEYISLAGKETNH